MTILMERCDANLFKFIEYEEGIDTSKNNELEETSEQFIGDFSKKKIKSIKYVKHEFVAIDKKQNENKMTDSATNVHDWLNREARIFFGGFHQKLRLDVKISLDQTSWTDLKFNYQVFEQKVFETIESLISNKESYSIIPFEWLGNFNIVLLTKHALGYNNMKMLSGLGGLKEDWKIQTWKIFDKFTDLFWNMHYVDVSFYMQDSEQAATLCIIYTDDLEKRKKHIKDHQENYDTLLQNAFTALNHLKSGEVIRLAYPNVIHWNPGIASSFVLRAITEELRKHNANLLLTDGTIFVKKF